MPLRTTIKKLNDPDGALGRLKAYRGASGLDLRSCSLVVDGTELPLVDVIAGEPRASLQLVQEAAVEIRRAEIRGKVTPARAADLGLDLDAFCQRCGLPDVFEGGPVPRIPDFGLLRPRQVEHALKHGVRVSGQVAKVAASVLRDGLGSKDGAVDDDGLARTVMSTKQACPDRETKSFAAKFEVKEDEDEKFLTFEGYASTFGNLDQGGDVVQRGAFTRSLGELRAKARAVPGMPGRRSLLPVLFGHDMGEPIGSFIELREDDRGLFARGILPRDDQFVRERVIPQMEAGSLAAMSIGFLVNRRRFEDDVRILEEVTLVETSLVAFPMNEQAQVTAFKDGRRRRDLNATGTAPAGQKGEIMTYQEKLFRAITEAQSRAGSADILDIIAGRQASNESADIIEAQQKARAQVYMAAQVDPRDRTPEEVKAYDELEKAICGTHYTPKADVVEAGIKAGVERLYGHLTESKRAKVLAFYKDLVAGSGPDGGYFLMPDRAEEMVRRIFETSPVRTIADVVTTTSDVYEIPLDDDEPAAGWVEEVGERPDTASPQVSLLKIPVHEMYSMPSATQKVLDDVGFDLESWLGGKVTRKFGRLENSAFVNGTGSRQPRGFLSYDAAAQVGEYERDAVSHVGAGTGAAFDPDLIIRNSYELQTEYLNDASWGMHRKIWGQLLTLRVSSDNQYLVDPSVLQRGAEEMLVGKRVTLLNDMPDTAAANAKTLVLADWREFYQIVDRFGVRVLRDPYTKKPYVRFYSTKRVGGAVKNFEAGIVFQHS